MAHAHSKSKNSIGGGDDSEVNPTAFHDFLGKKVQGQISLLEGSLEVSAAVTSDSPSAYYGTRPDTAIPAQFVGNKRSNSDLFMISPKEEIYHFPSSQSDPHKFLRCAGGEWNRANHPRAAQASSYGYQFSPPAADEGSRTGIKQSRFACSSSGAGRQPAGVLIRSDKQKTAAVFTSRIEAIAIPSESRRESGGRQMTIFYGGEAHVFDNVPPNKADVIMALAGADGESWSTIYKTDSAVKPPSVILPGNEKEEKQALFSSSEGKTSHGFTFSHV